MNGNHLGTSGGAIDTLTFASGTLLNVAGINGSGGLTKTTTGNMVISGIHTYIYTGTTTASLTLSPGGSYQTRINGTLQSVKASVPASPAIPTRFARLKVSQP
jgi:hypothetical protein